MTSRWAHLQATEIDIEVAQLPAAAACIHECLHGTRTAAPLMLGLLQAQAEFQHLQKPTSQLTSAGDPHDRGKNDQKSVAVCDGVSAFAVRCCHVYKRLLHGQ